MKFETKINVSAAMQAALGGFISAYILGMTIPLCITIAVFCALSGSYTDIIGFVRQVKAGK